MTAMPTAAISPDLLSTAPVAPHGKTREEINKTADEFESAFLSVMMGQMFKGVGEGGPGEFSGGQGAEMFKSFLMDAFSKQISRVGGVGVSDAVQKEMLKMQGLE